VERKAFSTAGLPSSGVTIEPLRHRQTCTIIVTDPNALTRAIHDRMPLVLDKADIESWLNGTGGAELLRRLPMIAFACGRCRGASIALAAVMTIRR
jgi:putative SOS response-associated peptidase YedK